MSSHKTALQAYKNKDYATALQLWEEEAKENNDQAFANLGLMYLKGEGVTKDFLKAKEYFEKGSELGNVSAQYNLGLMYYTSIGIEEDIQNGVKYLKLAAEQSHAGANFRLALHYLKDRSKPQNLKDGFDCMIKASTSGHAMASVQLMGIDNNQENEESPKNLPFRNKISEKKLEVLNDALARYIKPMLQKDGGDIVLVDFIDGEIPELRLCYMGNCAGCSLASTTTYQMIKQTFENVIDKHIKVFVL